jgi:chromosome condensin MukBEF ATPase and DNA-binding subunit MukB
MKMAQPFYVLETQILRRVSNDPRCGWRFTKHALAEMGNDDRTANDIQFAVMNGQVVLHEQKRDVLWRVEGRDLDGRRIQIIVAVYEQAIRIKIVTTF